MRYFVTGTAGFIGFHVAESLLTAGHEVFGYDSLNNYYDPELKRKRLERLKVSPNFNFSRGRLEDSRSLADAYERSSADRVIHLAAQAGVRYSLDNPEAYISANIVGTHNLLEACRSRQPDHLLFASTSSVYGGNEKIPFGETDATDAPMSLYAATKKSGEVLTHSYSHLFGITTTCFRFFTVYGPWGRPDMALFKFVQAIKAGQPIDVYGNGGSSRDYTYVADLIDAIVALADAKPQRGRPVSVRDTVSPVAPWRVVNIASGGSTDLSSFISTVEEALGLSALRNELPMQSGDVSATQSDPTLLRELVGRVPETTLKEGVEKFVEWYEWYTGA